MSEAPSTGLGNRNSAEPVYTVHRHPLPVRITHWINLVVLAIMLGSGLQIFNAHPALYWGNRSDADKAWLAMRAHPSETGEYQGFTRLFGREFNTTGVFGLSAGRFDQPEVRGFPRWATIPSDRWLAMGRRWHFFFAWLFVLNGLFYAGYAVASRHLARDLAPSGVELKGIGHSVRQHLSIRQLRAESAHGYNVLQKLSYLIVVFVLAPLVILTGLTMSPWLDSALPWLPALFDGRQSARAIHFIIAFAFVAFVLIHVAMVGLVGPVNHLRAMITGRLRVKEDAE